MPGLFPDAVVAQHPHLYTVNEDRTAIIQKIKSQIWAQDAWNKVLKSIHPYLS